MELREIGTTRQRRPVGAFPPTAPEYPVQRSVSIDPTVRSRSNFFHEFLEAVLDGVVWNRYDTPTRLEYRVQRSLSIDPTVGSRSKFFTSFRRVFSL